MAKRRRAPGRKGWGPFRSLLRERSVDFNLTLDVLSLQQEIQQLTMRRDLLASRVLQLRHSPTGSLLQTVREFFRVFREGLRVEPPRRRAITQSAQIDFLTSVVDEDELNSALGRMGGVAFFVEQLRRYSLLLKFICMKMDSFEIVVLDEGNVMVKTKGTFRLQVLRETIQGIFPHVLGNEWLCGQLVGAEVEAPTVITFEFNASNLICAYEPEVDYVAGFNSVLRDPMDVLELMGKARIGVKSTLAVAEDGRLEPVDVLDEPEQEAVSYEPAGGGSPCSVETPQAGKPTSQQHTQPPTKAPSLAPFQSVVGRYVLAFANGWWPEVDALATSARSPQRDFLREWVSPHAHGAVERVWKSICASFEFVGFRALSQPQVHYDQDGQWVSAHVRVAYDLAIDISTLQSVFPHVLREPPLVRALLDADVSCPSELVFQWFDGDPLVARISARLDWDTALMPLLPTASERAVVLTHAHLPM